jgi:hypothetical protein
LCFALDNKQQVSTAYGDIQGRVISSLDGTPNGKIEIKQDIWGEAINSFNLSSDGSFSIERLEPGKYYLSYYESGFLGYDLNAKTYLGEDKAIEIISGQEVTVDINIPYTASGITCQQLLSIGFDKWYSTVFLSDLPSNAEKSWIIGKCGECQDVENNILIAALQEDQQQNIIKLQNALGMYQIAADNISIYGTLNSWPFVHNGGLRSSLIGSILNNMVNQNNSDQTRNDIGLDSVLSAGSELVKSGETQYVEIPIPQDDMNQYVADLDMGERDIREALMLLPNVATNYVVEYFREYFQLDD